MYTNGILWFMQTHGDGVKVWVPIGDELLHHHIFFWIGKEMECQAGSHGSLVISRHSFIYSFFFGLFGCFLPLICEALKCSF